MISNINSPLLISNINTALLISNINTPRQENIQEESKKTGRKPLTSVKFRNQEENLELLKPQTRNLTMLKPVIDKKISSKSDKSKNSSKPVKSKPCASIFLPRDKNIHLTTQELPSIAPQYKLPDKNLRDIPVKCVVIPEGQGGRAEEGLDGDGHACLQPSDGTRATLPRDSGASHGLPRSRFASNVYSKPNNFVLLELNSAGPIREEDKISAAEPAPNNSKPVRDS